MESVWGVRAETLTVQDGRVRWDVERSPTGTEFPNEVIPRLDDGLRLANVFRSLFLRMELLPPVDFSIEAI